MIINTGSRTDIPAYYSDWFFRRVREGYVLVRNPYFKEQVIRYRLDPAVVDCLNFCTKNPMPMLGRMGEIADFGQMWFVTVTPYGKEIEPFVPDKDRVLEAVKELSRIVGIRSVSWRYDPVFLLGRYSLDFHIESFERMAGKLEGYVENCVISFIDLYEKTKRNFPGVSEVGRKERERIGQEFVRIGRKYGITIRSCCEGRELEKYGVDVSGCMSRQVMERAVGEELYPAGRHTNVREGCNCLLGNDIGVYNTCGHGCLYCYANYSREAVAENMQRHDPYSPFLIGGPMENDIVKEAKQESYKSGQIVLVFP